jgi:hypothetical protein
MALSPAPRPTLEQYFIKFTIANICHLALNNVREEETESLVRFTYQSLPSSSTYKSHDTCKYVPYEQSNFYKQIRRRRRRSASGGRGRKIEKEREKNGDVHGSLSLVDSNNREQINPAEFSRQFSATSSLVLNGLWSRGGEEVAKEGGRSVCRRGTRQNR